MTMSWRSAVLTLAVMTAMISGCGDDPMPMLDGGALDAGRDSGGADAGPDEDGGADDDGGPDEDGGGDMDGGGDVDGGGEGDGGTEPDAFVGDAGPSASDQIAMVRAAGAGTLPTAIRIEGAMVTYTIVGPDTAGDPDGMFVQGGPTGPALFVVIDPTAGPMPSAGNTVSFDVLEVDEVNGQHRVVMISNLTIDATGADPDTLAQDVSAVDVPAMIDAYESEMITLDGEIATAFAPCAAGFQCAQITTAGHATADATYRFRATDAVIAAHGLRLGCTLQVGPTPLWRRDQSATAVQAQPSAWATTDVTMVSCPAPAVTGASAIDATTVEVTFDAPILAGSVTGSAFTITGGTGATVTGAATSGSTVTLSTSTLVPGTTYTVTVGPSVTDPSGTPVSATMNTAMFMLAPTCTPATHLVISEVDPDQMGTDTAELVEIHNPTASAIDLTGMIVVHVNGTAGNPEITRATLSGSLAAGGFVVVGIAGQTLSLPAGVMRFDFAGTSLQNGPDGIALLSSTGAVIDAMAYGGPVPTVLLMGETVPTPLTEAATPAGSDTTTGSLQRMPTGCDRDTPAMDWEVRPAPTPGAPNG